MSDSTVQPDAALPGMKCVARDADAARPRCANAWSRAEVEFALAMLAAWNRAFAGVVGGCRAYDTRRNRFVAIQFARRNAARPADQRFSAEDVAAAIGAYADDPVNKKLARWKSFGDWFREAEDLIDRQLTRTGRPRSAGDSRGTRDSRGTGLQPVNPQRRAAAQRLRTHLCAVDECVYAAQYQMRLDDYLPRRIAELERHPGHAAYAPRAAACKRLLALHWQFDQISNAARRALESAAADVFIAAFDRVPGRRRADDALDPIDAARLHGLALALLDRSAAATAPARPQTEAPA